MFRRLAIALFVAIIALATKSERAEAAPLSCTYWTECVDTCPANPEQECNEISECRPVTGGDCVSNFCQGGWQLMLECFGEPT
jgi:hypothetical protein